MSLPGWTRHLPPGETEASTDLTRRGSLPAAWAAHWSKDPTRAVIQDVDGTWLCHADLLARTELVAGRLAAAGLRAGDRVLMSGSTSANYVIAHCAALRFGLVVLPLNSSYTRRELEVVLRDASPRAAIVDSPEMRSWIREHDDTVVVTATDVALADGPAPALDVALPDDPALLAYTSGTTGVPKGALLSHGNLLASAEALLLAWRWTSDDRLILCLPLFHMHGLGVGLHGTLLAGGSAILQDGFDVEAVLREADQDATLFFGVPTMYSRLAGAPGLDRLAPLRLCVSGSAPLSADLHHRIREGCGQVVLERYGMTETVMLVSNPYDGERRPGTVGFPLPGVELRLDTTDEILVRGPNVFAGYLNRPDANASAFTADGFFRTGDIGSLDDDGYVRIVGRAKELIITGGYNVYPREIEDVLREHPNVDDVAVAGTPSEEWGETVTAYVECSNAVFDPDALVSWAAERLAPYKRPRVVHRLDALPRNKLGKVIRDQLRPPE